METKQVVGDGQIKNTRQVECDGESNKHLYIKMKFKKLFTLILEFSTTLLHILTNKNRYKH